jgi:CheY-like chemotaxis protein
VDQILFIDAVKMEMPLSTSQSVLLVEDDDNDVILIKRAFEKSRLLNPIHAVENGEEALAFLSGQGKFSDRDAFPFPALLLLDLKLPKKTGFEVIQAVRSNPDWKCLLIVVLSSSNLNPDINRAYELGANSYLVKPPDFDNLTAMLKQLQSYWLIFNAKPN